MKIKLAPALLLPLALASCGNNGYAGKYSFQMGKQSGSHITASVELTEDPVAYNGVTYGKALAFFLQAKMSSDEESSVFDASLASSEVASIPGDGEDGEDGSFDDGFLDGIEDVVMDLLSEGITLPGYYEVAEEIENGRNRLMIGFNLGELLGFELPSEFNIGHEEIEKLIYSEIDSKSVYLTFPVSYNDIKFQLYWYGDDILADGGNQPEAHALNTHPTKEDIAKINETYPLTHDGESYRDFHVISMSLKRG